MAEFVTINVLLSEREYEQLKTEAVRTGEGTMSAAMRQRAGMPPKPIGLVKGKREKTATFSYDRLH